MRKIIFYRDEYRTEFFESRPDHANYTEELLETQRAAHVPDHVWLAYVAIAQAYAAAYDMISTYDPQPDPQ